ncbi:MAG TPA: septal ring lytic transglycosylase RlpA family protein [Stellaceae bacterium]|nr:septal ring lytic transglycosylase RlpA family protein [Stellaceae bacterium]
MSNRWKAIAACAGVALLTACQSAPPPPPTPIPPTTTDERPQFVQVGFASWYGPGFHGNRTADGERFDMNALTAAHRTLPFNSYVRVTDLATGRSVIVRINDRGPYNRCRIIDLSARAARELGITADGTARVRIDGVDNGAAPVAAARPPVWAQQQP